MLLNPSNASRWINCAASPWFAEKCPPREQTDEMREGTCAAWVADQVLKGDAGSAEDMTGETHQNGWQVTPDMVYYVQQYIDLVQSRGGTKISEQTVRLSPRIIGRLDSSTTLSAETLCVDDLKYGYKIVEAVENPTMIIYGAGEYLRINNPQITHVQLGIHQPRAFHPLGIYRTWTLTVSELMERAQKIIAAGDAVYEPEPVATPGTHCKNTNCPAASSCAALAMSVYADHTYVQDSRQRHMTGEELATEMNVLDDIENRLKARKGAVYAEAEERIKKGEFLRGWHLQPTYGNRVLTVDPKLVTVLTGIPATEEKVKSPAQLERDGVSPEIMKHISKTPTVGHKLKRVPKNYFNKAFKPIEQGK